MTITFGEELKSTKLKRQSTPMIIFGVILSGGYGAGVPLLAGGIAMRAYAKYLKNNGK